MRNLSIRTLLCLLVASAALLIAAPQPRARKIVLVAGIKTHAPGFHEYLKTVKLLKVMLDRSPNAGPVRTEVYYNGWPDDPSTLDTADTVLFFSDGQPGDKSPPVPYMTPERMKIVERAMRRGCGIVTVHYTTFITQEFADDIMEWQGGYYERKGSPETRSLIKTVDTDVALGTPEHPISRGLQPFKFKDEYYYRLKFRENDPRLKAILRVPELSEKPQEQRVFRFVVLGARVTRCGSHQPGRQGVGVVLVGCDAELEGIGAVLEDG